MYFDQFFKFEFSFTWHSRFAGQQAMIYPDDFWAYHYLDYKWLCRDGNVPSSSMLKSWWPSVGWNPWRLHIFHALEWFTGDKVCFCAWKQWKNITCNRKYQYKERYIFFFGCQNLGAHASIPVWESLWMHHWSFHMTIWIHQFFWIHKDYH